MKKLILITAAMLLVGMTHGQNLQKGNLIGTHVLTVTLSPGVTMDKFVEFFNTKVIQEIEKNYLGWKVYPVKGVRGENNNSFGWIFVIKSEKERDKYFNTEGGLSELGQTARDKIQPILDELGKLGTYTTKYTDWVII